MVFVIPVAATIVGATVSSAVYTSINTTGEISASLIGRGIGLASNVFGANSNSTRTVAVGSSIVAGTAAALLATGAVSGVKAIVNMSTNLYHKYMPTNKTPNGVLLLEDAPAEMRPAFTQIASAPLGSVNANLSIVNYPTPVEVEETAEKPASENAT